MSLILEESPYISLTEYDEKLEKIWRRYRKTLFKFLVNKVGALPDDAEETLQITILYLLKTKRLRVYETDHKIIDFLHTTVNFKYKDLIRSRTRNVSLSYDEILENFNDDNKTSLLGSLEPVDNSTQNELDSIFFFESFGKFYSEFPAKDYLKKALLSPVFGYRAKEFNIHRTSLSQFRRRLRKAYSEVLVNEEMENFSLSEVVS